MPVRSSRFAVRFAPVGLTIAMAVVVAAAAPQAPPLPGMTYTKHEVTTATGDGPMAAMSDAMHADYTGVVVFAAGRGRMDIVAGSSASPKFAQGDYVLFDSSDYIIVHPADKTFFTMPATLMSDASSALAGSGAAMPTMSAKDVTGKLDTLGPGDPFGGVPTQHYRTTVGYTMVIDMSGMGLPMPAMPPMQNTITTESWYADTPPMPPDPFSGMAKVVTGGDSPMAGLAGGAMKDVTEKQGALQAGLPTAKTAVKTIMSTQMSGVMSMGMAFTSEITEIKATDVDPNRLVLPDGYTQIQMPGTEMFAGALPKDGGAKWRVKPGGG